MVGGGGGQLCCCWLGQAGQTLRCTFRCMAGWRGVGVWRWYVIVGMLALLHSRNGSNACGKPPTALDHPGVGASDDLEVA